MRRPLPDRLNDRLERQRRGERAVIPGKIQDPEVDELATLARRLQVTPQLRVDPDFARQLEARLLAQHAAQHRLHGRATTTQAHQRFQRSPWKRFAFGTALIALLLLATMGTLSAAAQATNPNNPLYEVRRWVQRVQYPQTDATVTQANTSLNNAQNQLKMLTNQADSTHAAAYSRDMANLEQQITSLDRCIQTLPIGPDRDNLTNKLVTLKANARQTLRQLLPGLNLSEQLLTTAELGRLGDTVPRVDNATMVVMHASKQATVTITGDHLQPGAKLLIDDQLIAASTSRQNSTVVFIVSWLGKEPPKTIGILNPDGTAAQAATITFTLTEGNNNGNGQDKGNNNGNNNDHSQDKGNNNGNNNGNANKNGNTNKNSNNNNNGNINKNGNTNNNGNANNNGNGNGNGNGKGKGNGNGKVIATPTPTPTP